MNRRIALVSICSSMGTIYIGTWEWYGTGKGLNNKTPNNTLPQMQGVCNSVAFERVSTKN
jgi:hypothetical protein